MDQLISRQAAIDAICEDGTWLERQGCTEITMAERKQRDVDILSDLPSFSRDHENDRSAEPCEDAVSRKSVEEMLKNGLPTRGMWEIEGDVVKQTVCETLADALMDLEKLPSVTPKEQKWIPCSERLPDKNCRCLTTNDAWGAFEVDLNAWIDGQWLYPNDEPVAWMPLPEPWKREQHG